MLGKIALQHLDSSKIASRHIINVPYDILRSINSILNIVGSLLILHLILSLNVCTADPGTSSQCLPIGEMIKDGNLEPEGARS